MPDLNEDESHEAVKLGQEFKQLFLDAAHRLHTAAEERGLPSYVSRVSIVCEAMLLAAAAFGDGADEDFFTLAYAARAAARRVTTEDIVH